MELIVHINGWPGLGKLTIGRILAARLHGRLIDNHTLLNPAEALFVRTDPGYRNLRKAVRAAVLEHAAAVPAGTPLLFTDALADDGFDRRTFEDYRALAARRGAVLVSVVLDCEADENTRRLTAAGRAEARKLTDPALLASLRAECRLLQPEDVPVIALDVTALSPQQAADAITQALLALLENQPQATPAGDAPA